MCIINKNGILSFDSYAVKNGKEFSDVSDKMWKPKDAGGMIEFTPNSIRTREADAVPPNIMSKVDGSQNQRPEAQEFWCRRAKVKRFFRPSKEW